MRCIDLFVDGRLNGVLVLSHALVAWVAYIVGRHRGRRSLKRMLDRVGSRFANQL